VEVIPTALARNPLLRRQKSTCDGASKKLPLYVANFPWLTRYQSAVQWVDRIMEKIDVVFDDSSGDGKRWPRA
jgi:hypothetical protein